MFDILSLLSKYRNEVKLFKFIVSYHKNNLVSFEIRN
jgi:hypothetical protein